MQPRQSAAGKFTVDSLAGERYPQRARLIVLKPLAAVFVDYLETELLLVDNGAECKRRVCFRVEVNDGGISGLQRVNQLLRPQPDLVEKRLPGSRCASYTPA